MRTKIFYICSIAILAISLYGCGKEDIVPQRNYEYNGEATAFRDNQVWNAEIRTFNSVTELGFNLDILQYDKSILVDNLYLFKIPGAIGKYTIKNGNSYDSVSQVGAKYYTLLDGDVIDDVYQVDETQENYITIDEYDKQAAKIRGTFQVHTIIEKDGRFTESPPEVRFTSGEYETKVNPEWFE